MAARHVFRRPPDIRRRRFVPSTGRAASPVYLRRRLPQRKRPWFRVQRVRLVVAPATSTARGQTPILQRRLRRIARRVQRQRARIPAALGVQAQATSQAPIRQRTRRRQPQRVARAPRRPLVQGFETPRVVIPSVPVFGRFLRAISRIRRAARRRLFWREQPEILPAPPAGEESVMKGRIASPGLVRGRIVGGV